MTAPHPGSGGAAAPIIKWIACDFDEQSEDSIADTPEKAALAEAIRLDSECELNIRDLPHSITVKELRAILVTEENRGEWEDIDGANWFEIGKDYFYKPTGETVVVRVSLKAGRAPTPCARGRAL